MHKRDRTVACRSSTSTVTSPQDRLEDAWLIQAPKRLAAEFPAGS